MEVKYGDYHPYLFETSAMTDMRQETHLFQARGFLQEFARRRIDGDLGKEALEQARCLLSAMPCMGVFMDAEKASMPLEGAYAIIDWLLKCTQHVNNNIVRPMHRLVKDTLC